MNPATETFPTHYVKYRKNGEKRFLFLTSGGGGTWLRIHAARFTEENANRALADLPLDNPDFEFKKTPIARKKK